MAIEHLTLPQETVIVVGAGLAGIYTALELAPRPVLLVTAGKLGTAASSVWAQGGLAAALGDDDDPQLHLNDTINAGAGLVNQAAARVLVEGAPDAVRSLTGWGVAFDREADGRFCMGREAAHSRARVLHATGDRAGREIMKPLVLEVLKAAHITVLENCVVEELLETNGRVYGVLASRIGRDLRLTLRGSEVVLATGGVGGLFAVTTNPHGARGHGLAMAARVGARIMDAEFVQFHPTALDVGQDPAPLATEALRGAGALLINGSGIRFMTEIHADAELAPRDIVARAVEAQIKSGSGAFLDGRAAIGNRFPTAFPTVYEACIKVGIDPRERPVPIAPAAHYHMGGVQTDIQGRTAIDGLWACGEVACTGVHGANRLASNSLLEAVVFGGRIAQAILGKDTVSAPEPKVSPERLALSARPAQGSSLSALRSAMSAYSALLRSDKGLSRAWAELDTIEADGTPSAGLFNCLGAARAILSSARQRRESRGAHYREDWPQLADQPTHTRIGLNELSFTYSAEKRRASHG